MDIAADRVRRAQAGDELAFTRLVHDVYPQVYRWALIQTGAPDDADDVAQAAIIRMYRHLHDFRHDARFTTWLYAIVRRASADWRRTHRRRAAREQRYEGDPPAGKAAVSGIDADGLLAELRAALRELPVRQREVFDLFELQGLPAGEIAALLDLSPDTVRVHLLRARRRLRGVLLARRPFLLEELQ